jgi:hypothetical protein
MHTDTEQEKKKVTVWEIWASCRAILSTKTMRADPSGRAVYGAGLRPLACWDRGFESHRGVDFFLFYSVCVVR